MRKKVFGRQLSRTKNQRKALFRGLVACLVEKEELTTTFAKAKAIHSETEKLVTKAKSATLNDRRMILKFLGRKHLVNKLCDVIAPVFQERKGGYLRIVKLGERRGDKAEMVKMMFTENIPIEVKQNKEVLKKDTGEKIPETEEKKPKKVSRKPTKNGKNN